MLLSILEALKYQTSPLFNHFSIFLLIDKLIISDPAEFHERTFLTHLYQLPWHEPLFTRRVEQAILKGKHMTFCRTSKESVSVVSDITFFFILNFRNKLN